MTDTPLTAEAVAEMRALRRTDIDAKAHGLDRVQARGDLRVLLYENADALLALAERSLAPSSSNAEVAREIVLEWNSYAADWSSQPDLTNLQDRITAALDAKDLAPSAGMQRVIDEVNADIRACFKDREPAKAPANKIISGLKQAVAHAQGEDVGARKRTFHGNAPAPTLVAQPAERTVEDDEIEKIVDSAMNSAWTIHGFASRMITILRAERERTKAALWTCEQCGFAFDATHHHQDGSYSCPNCAQDALERRCAELEARIAKALELTPLALVHLTKTQQDAHPLIQALSDGTPYLAKLLDDARREGAEEMRKRCAAAAAYDREATDDDDQWMRGFIRGSDYAASTIRSLPLSPQEG